MAFLLDARRKPHKGGTAPARGCGSGGAMLDLVFIFATVCFFAVAVAYSRACERL
jgi:hypothetical protein